MDSGCTQHMTFDRSAFVTYIEQQTDRAITVGTKAEAEGAGTGDIDVEIRVVNQFTFQANISGIYFVSNS